MPRAPLLGQSLLREARLRSGLSQRALARRARTTQAVVARIELGQASPSVATLRRLLNAAGFELDAALRERAVLDGQVLDDVPRILALSPEDRLREVANLSRFVAAMRRDD
jgi:transcriptional regulator with XRE-family HTH domain